MNDRDVILAELRERARYYQGLETVGLPIARKAAVTAAGPAATQPRAAARPAPAPTPATAASTPLTIIAPAGHVPTEAPPGALNNLDDVRAWLGDCRRCKLAPSRQNIVFGQGNPNARLMFVGEAPGADEDEQGLAFVGRAGQLLTDIIEKGLKIPRPDVFIANVLKCLRYNTLVQLEDRSWERIGRLVASRYSGRVMSVDREGRLVPKRVVAWYRSALGERRVYKMSYVSSRLRGGNRAVTWLTEDHQVLTRRGWIEARSLTPFDEVAIGDGLSSVAEEVVEGGLLGDATISRASSHLVMIHARRQEEYVRLKARALDELAPAVGYGSSRALLGGVAHPTVLCRTRATRSLRVVRDRFYPEGKKRVPKDLVLTARKLAIWFLDDGYTRVKSGSYALSEIAAHSFVDSAVELLRALNGIGVEGYTRASSPGRIHFGAQASLRLSELIAPFCPPSLRYKLHPGVRDRVPFQADLFDPGTSYTLYDRVVIQPVVSRLADRSVFCIDVEDTHNFVTSGGVVHNCRPPGNRNPEPDEILSCQPFLERQIELIKPAVLVGLGKFAGQWLLKTAEPISRIRGRVGNYQGIPVIPTYHPAYLLRNPSAKKDVWADMKIVLELLAAPQTSQG